MKKRRARKSPVIFIVAVIVALLAGIAVYAAYTNLNSVKRVVSTQGSTGTAFSSNYLNLTARNTDSYALKNMSFSEKADSLTFEIDVCNYVRNDPSKVNENDITYTLKLDLLSIDGSEIASGEYDSKITIDSGAAFSNGKCSIDNQILAGNSRKVNKYILTVPKDFIDKVNVRVIAEPEDSSYTATDNYKLGRIFTFSEYNAAANTWTGYFIETTTDNYDGFNYVIRGQGKGTVTLSWDSSQLEISKVFLDNNSLSPIEADGKKSVTMNVDSNTKSRYDIQFYKTSGGDYSSIEALNGYVTVGFQSSQTTG